MTMVLVSNTSVIIANVVATVNVISANVTSLTSYAVNTAVNAITLYNNGNANLYFVTGV